MNEKLYYYYLSYHYTFFRVELLQIKNRPILISWLNNSVKCIIVTQQWALIKRPMNKLNKILIVYDILSKSN